MPLKIVDFYNARPGSLKPGDVLVATVTLHVTENGYRVYRCKFPPPMGDGGIPQGGKLSPEGARSIALSVFPVVCWSEMEPDTL